MKKFLTLLIFLAAAGAVWLLSRHRQAPAEAEKEKGVASVEVLALLRQPISQVLDVYGVVSASASGEHTIAAPYDCIVRKVLASVGKPVEAGDILLELSPSTDAQLAFDSARSTLTLAEKLLVSTQERFALKLSTRQDLLTAQQAVDDARLKVASLEARGFGGDGRIKAPDLGVISKLDTVAGVQVSQGAVLVSISSRAQLEARLGVEASDLPSVTAGQSVTLTSSNRSDLPQITALIGTVGASLDAATGAAELRVALPADSPLMPGERVKAQIEIKRKVDALVVPRSAVLPDEDKLVLYTVKDGKALRHEVKLGITSDTCVEVLSTELNPGDQVVTLGNYELENGMDVQTPAKEKDASTKSGAIPATEAKP